MNDNKSIWETKQKAEDEFTIKKTYKSNSMIQRYLGTLYMETKILVMQDNSFR